jgi:C4-dicarboxylate-specific signal transduction histidine kinase
LISKLTNPDLIDMTNREGLVQNEAFEEFQAHLRAEFRRFSDVVYEEFLEREWRQDEDRAREIAQRTSTDRDVLIRDIVHSLRQPVASLGTEMRNFAYVLEHNEIPPDTKRTLLEIQGRASAHVAEVSGIVRAAFEDPVTQEIEPVSIRDVVADAVKAVRPVAVTRGGKIQQRVPDRVVLAKRAYLRRALTELFRNALQAPRPSGESPVVQVTADNDNGQVVIRVRDNGVGVDPSIADQLFHSAISKKGRQGVGLITVRDLLATFGASARLVVPNDGGAEFQVLLPSMGEIRRILK